VQEVYDSFVSSVSRYGISLRTPMWAEVWFRSSELFSRVSLQIALHYVCTE
jgi:hypothetical protein